MWYKRNFSKKGHKSTSGSKSRREKSNKLTELTEQTLRELFKECTDVKFVSLQFHNYTVMLTYCVGMVKNDTLYNVIPQQLSSFFSDLNSRLTKEEILERLHLPSLSCIENKEQAISEIFAGKLFLDFGIEGTIFSVDISDRPQRNPDESKTEISLLGPRDNFIEDITVNMALIRKRLRTNSLVNEMFELGRRTKTKVAVLYINDIANQEILQQIKEKLTDIDIDGLINGTQLEELMNDKAYALFPRHAYTGRPDFVVDSLLNGRFVILLDGVSYAYVTPINLFYLLKSAEDKEFTYVYSTFERLMRIVGLAVATFLPGFFVALTAFHQNQLPLTFLATVVESRRGVPLPSSLEAILMLLLFELFREAGMRLPLAVGQTLSVIGGLIIGDAAIRAGLTSPAMLVVIAGSTIATFTLINQSLVGTISLIRFFVIILVSFFGFFGFFSSIFFVGVYIAKIRIFGVPYLAVASRIEWKNIIKSLFRLPEQKKGGRAGLLNPIDSTRKEGES
ncbi:spore germination protein [Neobacillus massiliamazoniensis]|uniref:Spore germination protein XA n=1 Tax=Neobacillus massiliamazoniensis TaxID=1499688 RepID=A0A0U1NXC9_9BACI|nr:spore germination protein [Neobacillus massiliamazoniensis]CRK82679.1 spore germination protein XA [Neobacillus massiliamazoniensis]